MSTATIEIAHDVEWLPPLKPGWTLRPLWSMFERIKDVDHPSEQMLSVFRDYGVVAKDSRRNLNQTAENRSIYQLVHPGWLVTNRMKAWQGSVGISPLRGIVSGHYICFAPRHREDHRYLNWLFRSAPYTHAYALKSRGVRIGQVEIDNDEYKLLPILLPPVDVQRAIADYLDRETARIDTLIQEQQRLVEMLRERRQAAADTELGARVGTSQRLKWFLEELDIRANEVPEDLPLMSVSIDWGVRRRDEVTADEARAADLSNYKVCRRGDLVINRMRAFQGALGLAPEDGIVSPDYAVLRAVPQVNGEWLAAAMKTGRFVSEMACRIKGIGSAELGAARTPRINVRDLCDIQLDVPDPGMQADEVARIRRVFDEIDTLITETENFIELAQERRAALITAAVTGQIDVREVA
ncbi:restriction endonuclease subunit S [Mycolicibacter arupensis]|nr:restriction endonuclease subunit S [Mycolicibacter arupensis]MCV7277709.1 restriction endonuclease subunit S [Mycolicibacter arupensis]